MEAPKQMPTPTPEELEDLRAEAAILEQKVETASAATEEKSEPAKIVSKPENEESKHPAEENFDNTEEALRATQTAIEGQERLAKVDKAGRAVNFDNSEESLNFAEGRKTAETLAKEVAFDRQSFASAEKAMNDSQKDVGRLSWIRNLFKSKEEKGAIKGEHEQKVKNFELAKEKYDKTKAEYGKFLLQKEREELNKDSGLSEKQKVEAMKKFYGEKISPAFLEECSKLNIAKSDLITPQDKKWYKDLLYKYSQLPKVARWAVSSAIALPIALTLAPGAAVLATGAGATYFLGIRFARAAAGGLAAEITGKIGGKMIKSSRQKAERAIKTEADKTLGTFENFEQLMDFVSKQSVISREQAVALDKREHFQQKIKAVAMIGAAGGTAYGTGLFENYFVSHGILPSVKGAITEKPGGARALQETQKTPALTEKAMADWEKAQAEGRAWEMGMEPGTDKWAKIHELATIKKGDGIEKVLIRQLENQSQVMGCPQEIIAKGSKAVHAWAQEQAHEIAAQEGYFNVKPDGTVVETRLQWDAKKPAEFLLQRDASTGKFAVVKMDAKTYLFEKGAVPMTKEPEISTEIMPKTEIPQQTLETYAPGTQEFYDTQYKLESMEILPDERLEEINNSIKSVGQKIDEIKTQLETTSMPADMRNNLRIEMKAQGDYQSWLEKIKETGAYKNSLTVENTLGPKIMEAGNFKEIMQAGKFADLGYDEKKLVNKLFYKYFNHSFENFRGLPAELRNKALAQFGQNMEKIISSDQAAQSATEINLPHKAYLWRNIGEMKWAQEIWDKFGKK